MYKKKCDELHYEANIDTTGIGFTILSYFNDENDDYVDFIEGYSKSLPIGSYDYYCAIDKIKGKDKYEYSNNIADILDAIESCKSDKWKIEIDGNTAEGDINLVLK